MSTRVRLVAYGVIAGIIGILFTLGRISSDQHAALLATAGATVDLVAAVWLIVAARHITEDAWSGFRRASYVVVAAVLTTLGMWGIFDPAEAPLWMSVLDQALSIVSVLLFGTAIVKVPHEQPATT